MSVPPKLVAARALGEQHMQLAKRRFSEAARAAVAGDPEAPALALKAHQAVVEARRELLVLRAL